MEKYGALGPAVAPVAGRWRKAFDSDIFYSFRRQPGVMLATLVAVSFVVAAIFAPWVAPHNPFDLATLNLLDAFTPPAWSAKGNPTYLLGTDDQGRDVLSAIIFGSRMSLLVGLIATLLAIALSGALGAGISNAVVSLTIVFIPPIARVAEAVTTQIRTRDYIEAARASGAGAFTIIRVHVLGNVLGPIFVYATSLVSVSMILASGLSFLGLGSKPPEPEWGLMLNTLRTAIYVQPLVAALPGAMIFVTSICFNLMSDGLRSAMDVKL